MMSTMMNSLTRRFPIDAPTSDDPRDVVGVLVFIAGLAGFGVAPLFYALQRLL